MVYTSQDCQIKAWRSYHKYECQVFVALPDLPPMTRALYRLLNKRKHDLVTTEQWEGLRNLQSHQQNHMTSTNAQAILGACVAARDFTGTDLELLSIQGLYCQVIYAVFPQVVKLDR